MQCTLRVQIFSTIIKGWIKMPEEAMVNYPRSLKVLMVSTEYPPMMGGVGRYTANLTAGLKKRGIEVLVVCNERGNGDFTGISPTNRSNSDVLFDIVKKSSPIWYIFSMNTVFMDWNWMRLIQAKRIPI